MSFLIVLLSFTHGYAGSPLMFESFSLQGLVLFWGPRLSSCSTAPWDLPGPGIEPVWPAPTVPGKSLVFLLDELILD